MNNTRYWLRIDLRDSSGLKNTASLVVIQIDWKTPQSGFLMDIIDIGLIA